MTLVTLSVLPGAPLAMFKAAVGVDFRPDGEGGRRGTARPVRCVAVPLNLVYINLEEKPHAQTHAMHSSCDHIARLLHLISLCFAHVVVVWFQIHNIPI